MTGFCDGYFVCRDAVHGKKETKLHPVNCVHPLNAKTLLKHFVEGKTVIATVTWGHEEIYRMETYRGKEIYSITMSEDTQRNDRKKGMLKVMMEAIGCGVTKEYPYFLSCPQLLARTK